MNKPIVTLCLDFDEIWHLSNFSNSRVVHTFFVAYFSGLGHIFTPYFDYKAECTAAYYCIPAATRLSSAFLRLSKLY
jgi:glycerol-3-phosphate acyltransferase PlsY